MNPDAYITLGATVVTGGFAAWGARSARRTRRDHRRDDFTAITEQQNKAIERLEKRVALREQEAERLGQRITDQDAAIDWLRGRLRDLVGYIRTRGEEPPTARPIPERAARILNGIDV
jgi:uncharacterized coiled-coil protein SlyX